MTVQLAGRVLEDATWTLDSVDTRQVQADLRKRALSHQDRTAVIKQIHAQQSDIMSRAEVERLQREVLARVEERLSKLEQEVSRNNDELESHRTAR